MNENSIRLKDGRKIGYAEYGDRHGTPIMFFHGTPGSRLLFLYDDPIAASLGVRLISLDRPGFGISDPKPGRTIPDWADDVRQVADVLALEKFSVIGVSGGGAYAAACACKMPERLHSAALVSSVAPFENQKAPKAMMRANKIAFFLSRKAPWLLKASYRAQKKMLLAQPEKFMKQTKEGNRHLNEWDRQFLQTEEQLRTLTLHLGEAFRVSVDECATEPSLIARPWGFALKDLKIPVDIWHGEQDTMAPLGEIMKCAATIATCDTHVIPRAGHFVMDDEQNWRNILETILKRVK